MNSIEPTGQCYCGCKSAVGATSYFLPGHDKKAEAMLTKLQHGPDNAVARRLARSGFGPGGKSLLDEYQRVEAMSYADFAAQRLEFLAFQTLQEMSGRPGISHAVVFTAPGNARLLPTATPAEPAPKAMNTTNLPLGGGTVIAWGFDHVLSEEEQNLVRLRFGGQDGTWSTRT